VVDRRRRVQVIVMLLIVVAALLVILLTRHPAEPAPAPPPKASHPTTAVRRPKPARPRRVVDLGEAEGHLPQTQTAPSSTSARFRSQMASLWDAVVRNDARLGRPAFFPRSAYEQLKAIPNAGGDWENRLFGDFALDVAAAHELVAGDPASAKLVEVHVVDSYAHWIAPGICANSIGYYEMPNARVVYDYRGGEHSFGIASMISWRGVWYVVHLGAILRETSGGVVDEAASGPGTSAYSGTC
jgi:hypothetical protein